MSTVNKILVPIDFSEATDDVVEFVSTLAKAFNAEVELLHVSEAEDVYSSPPLFYSDREFFKKKASNLKEEIEALLEHYSAIVREKGITVCSSYVSGNPFVEIIKKAQAGNFDLITIGSHGRSGLEYFFMGSVAEQIVRNAGCAVLTLKKRGFKFKPLWRK